MSRAQTANDRAADFIERREMAGWSDADQAELDGWLAESFGNRSAYWRLEHGWREADRIGALGSADGSYRTPVAKLVRWPRMLAMAACLALVIGAGSILTMSGPEAPVDGIPSSAMKFATPIGGKRMIPLDDGSKVEINTASVVRTSITASNRDIWLEKGEAYFEVAHLGGRPFVVHAGSRTITVLGTKFSVRRDGDKVTVSVLEGRVRVTDAKLATESATVITAGDMVVAQGASTLLTQKSAERVRDALSWRVGMLNFDQSPLASVAAEFNRYNRRQIVVTGAEASRRRIGGAFPAADPQGFARLLGDAYGLHVQENSDAIIISD
jgi:transmembrane sensor